MSGQKFPAAEFSGADLSCRRGGRTVFTGLSFRIVSGEVIVLRGPNGSGKTTRSAERCIGMMRISPMIFVPMVRGSGLRAISTL